MKKKTRRDGENLRAVAITVILKNSENVYRTVSPKTTKILFIGMTCRLTVEKLPYPPHVCRAHIYKRIYYIPIFPRRYYYHNVYYNVYRPGYYIWHIIQLYYEIGHAPMMGLCRYLWLQRIWRGDRAKRVCAYDD